MKIIRNRSLVCILVTLFVSLSLPAQEGPEPDQYAYKGRYPGRYSLHKPFFLFDPVTATRLRGLELTDITPAGSVSRYLIETPQGHRLIFTVVLDPNPATHVVRLEDDATGWWAEEEVDFHAAAEDLDDFLAKSAVDMLPYPYSMVLRSRGGPTIVATMEEYTEHPEVLIWAAVEAQGMERRLARSIPASLRTGLLFLDSVREPQADAPGLSPLSAWRSPLHVLARSLEVAGLTEGPAAGRAAVEQPFEEERAEISVYKGLGIVDPDLLEFVATFHSLENANPLPERDVARLLGVAEGQLEIPPVGAPPRDGIFPSTQSPAAEPPHS